MPSPAKTIARRESKPMPCAAFGGSEPLEAYGDPPQEGLNHRDRLLLLRTRVQQHGQLQCQSTALWFQKRRRAKLVAMDVDLGGRARRLLPECRDPKATRKQLCARRHARFHRTRQPFLRITCPRPRAKICELFVNRCVAGPPHSTNGNPSGNLILCTVKISLSRTGCGLSWRSTFSSCYFLR